MEVCFALLRQKCYVSTNDWFFISLSNREPFLLQLRMASTCLAS